MKIITAIFIIGCLSLSFVNSLNITTWGITDPDATLLGKESVFAAVDNYQYQLRVLQFPMGNRRFPITLIKHYDYAYKPVNVTFVYGGISKHEVVILLKSKTAFGINSTFEFWGYGL